MTASRTARVRLSPALAGALGRPAVELRLPDACTAADVLDALRRDHPASAPLLSTALLVAADRVLGRAEPVPDEAELALLHPVAGG